MLSVTAANITDRVGAISMLETYSSFSMSFADRIKGLTGATVEVAKRNGLHKFEVIPKRWIVERSFGWLDKNRRFWKNCERKLRNTLQLITLAFIRLLLKRY